MKKHLTLFLFLLFLFSCALQKKEIITKSSFKLEGKNTNIRNLLDIDGYYTSIPDQKNLGGIMFFEDGSWVSFYFKINATDSDIRNNLSKSITRWEENKLTRWGTYWGVYTLKNDTILLHQYFKGTFWGNGWSVDESRFKIVDHQTIKYIYFKPLLKVDECYYHDRSPWMDGAVSHFVRTDSLPSSDCWLKEEKWIWSNESDWEAYMERIKLEKKKK